jgi:predicted transcriptional regulator
MLKEKVVALVSGIKEEKLSSVTVEVAAFYDNLIAKILEIPEGDEATSGEVEDLKAALADEKAKVEELSALLAKVDGAAKAIDALIPDAPAAEPAPAEEVVVS